MVGLEVQDYKGGIEMSLSDEFYEALHELEGKYERWQDLPDDHPKIKRIKKLARVNEGLTGKNTWYPEEITFIQNNIDDLTYNEMAIELERGYHELKIKLETSERKDFYRIEQTRKQ